MNIKSIFLAVVAFMGTLTCAAQTRISDLPYKLEAPKPSVVFFMDSITPENLINIYKALGREAKGKVCVKLSTGEAGNSNYLSPDLIGPFVKSLRADIVECNTAYPGKRNSTEEHRRVAREHGFTAIAPVVIMDEAGEITLPVTGGRHLKENYVGKDWEDYDFTVILSHFKGHPMAGFGGALKNMAIGMASAAGKTWIHSAGKARDWDDLAGAFPEQDDFLESMAEACQSVMERAGDNILYISVANNLSVDCDCVSHPEPVKMKDIGIFASLDPVALDRACVDFVYLSEDPGKEHLIERMESRDATHILDWAEELGLGSQDYILMGVHPVNETPEE